MAASLDPAVYTSLEALLGARRHCHELPLFSRPVRSGRQSGQQSSRLRGRGVDFDQVRAYQPGDDIRNIDWRVTARTQKVHTKVFNEERERPVFVIGEQSPRLFFGSQRCFKSVLAAETCALIAWTALSHHDRVGGMVYSPGVCHEVRPRRDRKALLQLLQLLLKANHALQAGQQAEPEDESEALNLALRHSREIIRPGSILYIICDHAAIDGLNQSLLVPLAGHNDLVLLPVFDPLDTSLPLFGPLDFVQGEQRLTIDTLQSGVRQTYAAQFEQQQQNWLRLARRLRCSLIPLDTRFAAHQQLHDTLTGHPRGGPR
ncbi:Protein of unknown function DUF58 [Halopseudomonas sabulinigri]|uniref:DUF58 domain-containing protein n=1 Tax=Halopseudomonas sabulinigri TaxID=472181 RepID=A0A1H1NBB0_9GAMM|nr:DUF58 domain-containing protein [Halopseudomonas sabulinigri]SDR96045.1 Protein of unknown function DUF58 [Halopseudomonas sabulinigri]